jgi:competence protein ComFC
MKIIPYIPKTNNKKMLPLWIKLSILSEDIRLFILDMLFPIKCLGCQTEKEWFCGTCHKKIKIREQQLCPLCEKKITPDGRVCFSCKKETFLAGMLVATSYQDPMVSKMVHLFKYRFIKDLSEPLSEIILKAMQSCELPLPEIIIPIPLHPKRLRWRGFNQSALLAENISKKLLPNSEIRTDDKVLIRKRHTSPQMRIKNHSLRNQNIFDAFAVVDSSKIKDRRILLVDDIATTGSTIFECARVLKNAGAKEVFAVVIARQEYKKKF